MFLSRIEEIIDRYILGCNGENSIAGFADKCRQSGTDLFLAPCDPDSYKYETTGKALESGAVPISSMTHETAYVKVLIGTSLGLKGTELASFLNEDINKESVL